MTDPHERIRDHITNVVQLHDKRTEGREKMHDCLDQIRSIVRWNLAVKEFEDALSDLKLASKRTRNALRQLEEVKESER